MIVGPSYDTLHYESSDRNGAKEPELPVNLPTVGIEPPTVGT